MSKTKAQIYHDARRSGRSDAEANTLAGFSSRTPEHVRKEWTAYAVLKQIRNSWGEGPRAVEEIVKQARIELASVQASIERLKGREDDLLRTIKMSSLGIASQNEGSDDQIHRNFISPVDADDEAG